MADGILERRIALVTGAGRGIGRCTVDALQAQGATVVAGLESDKQREAVEGLDCVLLDVREETQWADAVEHCRASHGGLNILVNNAGILREGTAEETAVSLWEEVLAVNLRGVFLGCKHVIPVMRADGGGAIVNVASIDALNGNHRKVAYAASKGGVVSMTRALAIDHAGENIRVNSVCPGTVRSQMAIEWLGSYSPEIVKAKHPLGREAEPEEIANVIAFLCGPGASFMTGMAIPVDGGRSIR